MKTKFSDFSKVKKKYLKFIKSQEVAGELFKDKLGQLNNYYIPISEMIYKNYSKNKRDHQLLVYETKPTRPQSPVEPVNRFSPFEF